jgi:hypothetical protein
LFRFLKRLKKKNTSGSYYDDSSAINFGACSTASSIGVYCTPSNGGTRSTAPESMAMPPADAD